MSTFDSSVSRSALTSPTSTRRAVAATASAACGSPVSTAAAAFVSGSAASSATSSPGRCSSHHAMTAARNAEDPASSASSAGPPSFARLAGVNPAMRRSTCGTSAASMPPNAVAAASASRARNGSGRPGQSTPPGTPSVSRESARDADIVTG